MFNEISQEEYSQNKCVDCLYFDYCASRFETSEKCEYFYGIGEQYDEIRLESQLKKFKEAYLQEIKSFENDYIKHNNFRI